MQFSTKASSNFLRKGLNIACEIGSGQPYKGVKLSGFKMLDYLETQYIIPNTEYHNSCCITPNIEYISYYKALYNTCVLNTDKINCFGGDHSISIATLPASLEKTNGNLTTVWIDAHGDMNTPETSLSKNTHGMPIAYAMKMFNFHTLSKKYPKKFPKLKSDNLFYIGVRDLDPYEEIMFHHLGIKTFSVDQANNDSQSIFEEIADITEKRNNKLHFSFDFDSVDPSLINSTGTPVAKGLTLDSALNIVKNFTYYEKTIATEFVEYNPELGDNNKSWENIKQILNNVYLN